jgi:hypothetical protein
MLIGIKPYRIVFNKHSTLEVKLLILFFERFHSDASFRMINNARSGFIALTVAMSADVFLFEAIQLKIFKRTFLIHQSYHRNLVN